MAPQFPGGPGSVHKAHMVATAMLLVPGVLMFSFDLSRHQLHMWSVDRPSTHMHEIKFTETYIPW